MSMITLQEASRRLNVSRATLYRWSRQGRIRLYQVGPRSTRVREEDLRKLEQAQTVHPSDPWEEAREVDLLDRLRELEQETPDSELYLQDLARTGIQVRWNEDLSQFEPLQR